MKDYGEQRKIMVKIIESKYLTSAVEPKGYPDTIWKDFAFVGRSNVGKSSMINTITNRKLLAKIANKPGKTRLINFFEIKYKIDTNSPSKAFGDEIKKEPKSPNLQTQSPEYQNHGYFGLVDLPGYGYARVSKTERDQWQKMINTFFQKRKQLSGAIVLVDIRHEPDPKDIVMIKMLQELKVNFILAATKCDKIAKNTIEGKLRRFKKEFGLTMSETDISNITEFSSLKKVGVEKILNWIMNSIFNSQTEINQSGKLIIHDKE